MKSTLFQVLPLLVFLQCGNPSRESQSSNDMDSTSANEALYHNVMDIHDEVMPRTEDLYKLKKRLQDSVAANPSMPAEAKAQLEQRIASLDSVNKMMMDWMHHFSPPADSVGQEVVREYLEGELEKIKEVREAILGIIADEKGKTRQ